MMRKLFGYFLGLIGLIVYIFAVSRLIEAYFPDHIVLEFIVYAMAGIGWIFPAMMIIKWWYKPKNNNEES